MTTVADAPQQIEEKLSHAAAHLTDLIHRDHPWHASRGKTPHELAPLHEAIRQARLEAARVFGSGS